MEPKLKAEELVSKYLLKVKINSRTLGESNITITNGEIILQTAIQCALIAADEIIKNNLILFEDVLNNQYWQEVKQEIYKL
jgi:hypothetical protein